MKLKGKLKNWLFKEELNDIEMIKTELKTVASNTEEIRSTYDECLKQINQAYKILCEAIDKHNKSYTLLEDCRKFMNSICDVGVDVGHYGADHSWAVICVHGKIDYVKFVDMNQRDIMDIANFLRRFEYSNRATDSPLHKRYIEDMIVKW